MFFYKLKIFFLRVLGYEKPLRVGLLKYLTLRFKTFRPYYETILLESVLEAKELGYKKVSVLELGVAGGNGIITLEKYKKKIEKLTNIQIEIYGFDTGDGLPQIDNKYDLPFLWSTGDYKNDKYELEKRITSKIFYGDIKDTFEDFIKTDPEKVVSIFIDLDLYTSTKNFLNQLPKFKHYLSPRVYCYFDDVFIPRHYINEHNGELLAIKEFNDENTDIKIGKSVSSFYDFKFPTGTEGLFMMHNFSHKDYFKKLDPHSNFRNSLSLKDKSVKNLF